MRYKKFLSVFLLLALMSAVCALWIYGHETLAEIGAGLLALGFLLGYRGDLQILEALYPPSGFCKRAFEVVAAPFFCKEVSLQKKRRPPK